MTMDKQSKHIAEQAAAYFVQRRGETMIQRREREAWLADDEQHERAYEETRRLWDRTGNLRDDAHLQALKAADLAALQRPRWFRADWILSAAAALILLLGVAYLAMRFMASSPPVTYAAALGERRTEVLADGTQVVLNTDSAIEARYTRGRRSVELQRGEAQFEVTHDAARPFVVSVGEDTVTALGTRFQVRRDTDVTVVTLLKGRVEVAQGQRQRILQPNQQARLSANAGIVVQAIDPAQVDGWLDGWLRFRNAPLGQVVAEANRYSSRKLRLGDPALAGLVLNGNFHTGDSASIASAVEQILPVRVDDRGADIVLLAK
jgi:transmembrane sensor